MEDPQPSKFTRIKQFVKDNEGPLMFGAGIGIGAMVVSQFPGVFLKSSRYPFGSSYNPNQPIPSLLLSEETIKKDIAASILAVEFFKRKGLMDEFLDFAPKRADEMVQEVRRNKA